MTTENKKNKLTLKKVKFNDLDLVWDNLITVLDEIAMGKHAIFVLRHLPRL